MSRVRVATCRDDAEAALVEAALAGHGIDAFIGGRGHAALAGIGASAVELPVWVDAEDAEEAAALIAELREGGAAELVEGERPEDDEADELVAVDGPGPVDIAARVTRRRRKGVVIAAGLIAQHGTAHLMIGAWVRFLVLAFLQIIGWRTLAAGAIEVGLAIVIGAVATDVVGAVLAMPAAARTLPPARVLPP